MKVRFDAPYKTIGEAIKDKFAKWPTNKNMPNPITAFWTDACKGAEARLKRAAENAEQRTLLKLGKEIAKKEQERTTDEQLGRAVSK